MGEVRHLQVRAERCRTTGFGEPVVASVEEARRLAREIAGELAGLSGREALLCLASLQEVQTVLAARVSRVEGEMAATRRELRLVGDASRACQGYALAARGRLKGP